MAANWFARSLWSHGRLIFLSRIVSPSIRPRCVRSIARWIESDRQKGLQHSPREGLVVTPRRRATDAVGQNAQLLHKWKVLPARAEIAIRRVKVVAGNVGTQPRTPANNGDNMERAPRRATNADDRRLAHTANFSQLLSLKTCICLRDCQARRMSSNCGRQNTFLWCPFSTTKTSETPSSAQTSNSCEQQHSPIKHSGIHRWKGPYLASIGREQRGMCANCRETTDDTD